MHKVHVKNEKQFCKSGCHFGTSAFWPTGLNRRRHHGYLVYDQNQVSVSGTETMVQFCYRNFFFYFKKIQIFLNFSHFLWGISLYKLENKNPKIIFEIWQQIWF